MSFIDIRPISPSDADSVQLYAADSRLAATCNVPHPYPVDGGAAFVEKAVSDFQSRRRFAFAIIFEDSFAGIVGLNHPDFDSHTIAIDYWVAVPFWGKGVATQAVHSASGFAFSDLQMKMVFSGCLDDNLASIRVLEKNGFAEIDRVINDGAYGSRFRGKIIRRFRLVRPQKSE